MTATLSPAQVADLLIVLGAIARIVDEPDPPTARVASIRRALANVGITSDQTRAARVASIRRACARTLRKPEVREAVL